jgi:hypothetical protein
MSRLLRLLGLLLPLVVGAGLALGAEEKKDAPVEKKEAAKEEKRGGTVTGTVTAKGDPAKKENWIEVKADGEEKGRRYVPHWRGGLPKDGGGPDKEIVAQIKEVPIGSRVRIEWSFQERPRVEKIEVLKKGEGAKEKAKDKD